MSEEECVLDEQGVESFESLYEKLMVVVERRNNVYMNYYRDFAFAKKENFVKR